MTEIPGVTCNPSKVRASPAAWGRSAVIPIPRGRGRSAASSTTKAATSARTKTGELLVKTPIIMQGYFRDPEQTRDAFRDGWFMTGDLVQRDADGYFFFVSRKKDIIRRRGENIAGAELDRVIGEHPGGARSGGHCRCRRSSAKTRSWSRSCSKPGQTATAQEIAQWCREHLARAESAALRAVRRRAAAHADAQGVEGAAEE